MLQTQITNTNSREMFVLLLQDLVFISHNERTDHEESFQIKVVQTAAYSVCCNHADFPTLFRMKSTFGFPHSIAVLINPENSYLKHFNKQILKTCSMSKS